MIDSSSDIIERLENDLQAERDAREALESALNSQAEMVAVLAHEVRTPLGAVISLAELLARTNLDDVQRGYTETLVSSAKGLVGVVNDVLDHAKLQSDSYTLSEDAFEMRSFFKEFTTQVGAGAAGKGLMFTAEVDDNVPEWLIGDPIRIRQVLTNFSNNALKFTEEGYIALKVRAELTDSDVAFVRFEVHDTGPGFSPGIKDKLFDPYFQADNVNGAPSDGTGLGLYIVSKLSRLMDGDCGCACVEGAGSVFWLTVPLRIVQSARDVGPESANAGLLEGHVLIVDDNNVNGMIAGAIVEQFGLTFEIADSGERALLAVKTRAYDAVLMDWRMPGFDGFETARLIRLLDGAARTIPIIAVTASAQEVTAADCLAAGVNDCVGKPIRSAELLGVLSRYLRHSQTVLTGTHI